MTRARWLTPQNHPPGKFLVRRLVIPADYQYIEIVNGALLDLCYASNFELDGDATPEECAEAFGVMYDEFTKPVVDPPGWEGDEDVDGTPAQPWYNNLADWIIEGFLAISGFPQAAIIYSTTIPKLRLAIQQHNLGSLIKILLNNLELYSGDTYSPITELVGQTLDLAGFAAANNLGDPPWELKIIHDGPGVNLPEGQNGFLHVVRKRWTDEMPIQFRQDDPCRIEYSEDDGANWNTVADLTLCVPPAEMMTGAMIPWLVETTPDGWLRCDGSAISRETYAALFDVLGSTWGDGDGNTTFNLPDFRDRAPIGDSATRTVGQTGGEAEHTLTIAEMPAHEHVEQMQPYNDTGLIAASYAGGAGGTTIGVLRGLSYNAGSWDTVVTQNAGGGGAHNNMGPYGVVRWIVKT